MSEQWSKEKLLELSGSFLLSRILISAAELDLFSKMETEPRTVDELSQAEGWDARGLRILMDALAAHGLLSRSHEGQYAIPASLRGLLSSTGTDTVLPMIVHRGRMWESWSNLTRIVQTGRNPNPMGIDARSDDEIESFIGAMEVVGRIMAGKIAESVDLSSYANLLDVGGGPGTYCAAFLKRAPHMRATLFDLERVVNLARKRLAAEGLLERVKIVAGDYSTDELPPGHDLVLLSAVIHSNSRQRNQELYEKVFRSLGPGGIVLIRDFILDQTRTFPPEGAVFAVNMLCATRAGDCYTFDEIREDLERAGFVDVRMLREGTKMDQLLAATKP
jgi:SAM-dependent methyltransferase